MKGGVVWGVIGLALLGVIGWRVVEVVGARRAPRAGGDEVVLVRTGKVRRADLAEKLAFHGSIRPLNEVEVYPKLGGRIERLEVQVGDKVKAGQLLAVVEHKEIAWQAKAALAAVEVAKAGVAGAQLEHDRVAELFKGGSATKAMLEGAQIKLSLARAQLAQAEAAAGLAQQAVANATITAPIAGTVVRRPVSPGAMVGQQSVLVTIQDTERLKLEAAVDAAAFARLQKGAPASITVDALPGESFPGTVTILAPSLDSLSRRASIEIEIDNASGRLLPNMFARAQVTVGKLEGSLAVPKAAIYQAPGGAVVYRVRDGLAQLLRPKLGPEDDGQVAVFAGLAEGDEVAVSGVAELVDGAPVRVVQEPAGVTAGAPN
ncbi:MAG: efflux RND transporter periplasmic adaptor subunit [Myxococcales bacterium]|jgi:membrane fusion protein (multidrug efflux system)